MAILGIFSSCWKTTYRSHIIDEQFFLFKSMTNNMRQDIWSGGQDSYLALQIIIFFNNWLNVCHKVHAQIFVKGTNRQRYEGKYQWWIKWQSNSVVFFLFSFLVVYLYMVCDYMCLYVCYYASTTEAKVDVGCFPWLFSLSFYWDSVSQ